MVKKLGDIKMRTYSVLVLASCMLLNFSCAEDSGKSLSGKGLKIYHGFGFSVECPKRVKVKEYPPKPIDFFTYQFIDNDKILLLAYAGNHPSLFDNAKEEKPDKEERINGLTYKFYSTKDINDVPTKQVLVIMPQDIPSYLHFWYFNLSPEEQQIAEAIIFSAS